MDVCLRPPPHHKGLKSAYTLPGLAWTPPFAVRVTLNANNKLMSQVENVKAGPRSLRRVHTVSSRRLTDAKRFTHAHARAHPPTDTHTHTVFHFSYYKKGHSCLFLSLSHLSDSAPRSIQLWLLHQVCRHVRHVNVIMFSPVGFIYW